jgi:hypothetical protein
MDSFVYRCAQRPGTYVYLRERDAFGMLPPELARRLGKLEFVFEVALTAQRRLAHADPEVVRRNLLANGFHLQLPPGEQAPARAE